MISNLRRLERRVFVPLCAVVLVAVGLVVGPIATSPAEAATITIGAIKAQAKEHHGTVQNDGANCIRYAPASTSTSSGWVTSSNEAATAHGWPANGSCPSNLSTSGQSAVGVTPATTSSITDGTPFLLARVVHYNNAIDGTSDQHYTGATAIQLGGFDSNPTFDFGWTMYETNNNDNPCAFPGGPNANGCADQIVFTSTVSPQTLTKDGRAFTLRIDGFAGTTGGNSTCPATASGSPSAQFLTAEGQNTPACLYATLVQVRSLTIVKKVVAPAGTTVPGFGFTSSSDLSGSAWDAASFTLTPPSVTQTASTTKGLHPDETTTVSESAPSGDQWALTGISCVDEAGGAVPGVTTNVGSRSVSIARVGAPPTETNDGITCTFTNTYTPKGTLTLTKTVNGGSSTPDSWTLSATGPTTISGRSGQAAVTNKRVGIGEYTLTEEGSVSGYVNGSWTCTGATPTVTNGVTKVTVVDGANVSCAVTNRFATGSFTISKTVTGPTGGFTGTTATPFSGSYVCGSGDPVNFSVTQTTPYQSPQIAAGVTCTITENQPSGNLANTSWSWSAPTYPDGKTVTITDQTNPNRSITNTYSQAKGSVKITKLVAPRTGTPTAGYTGGTNRSFPVSYDCKIGGATVLSGNTSVSVTSGATISNIPATASCTLTETQTRATGDFVDASYDWDGMTWSPATAAVVANQTTDVTVTNHFVRRFATIKVEKTVTGGGYTGSGKAFSVDWDCGGTDKGTRTIAAGGTETIAVPANASCTVSEKAPAASLLDAAHEWGTPSYSGLTSGAVTVAAGQTATVTITNPTVAVFGKVSVTKAISPTAAASGVKPGSTFAVNVACDAPAQGQSNDYAGNFDVTIGTAQTTPNLPVGTSCTVTETAPASSILVDGSYAWGTAPAAQTVVVDTKNATKSVTVTNPINRVYGTFTITKTIDKQNFDVKVVNSTFSGTWSCTYGTDTPLTGTWSVTNAGAATLTDVPDTGFLVGSTCSATETSRTPAQPVTADHSYVWGAESISDPVTIAAKSASITVKNPIERVTGVFSVAKVVRGGSAPAAFESGTPFTFDFTCTPQSGDAVQGTITVADGETASLADGIQIPVGSECIVTERTAASDVPAPVDPYRWDGQSTQVGTDPETDGPSATFTVTESETPIVVKAFNTISRHTTTVEVSKTVAGATVGFVDPDTTFSVSLDCTLGDETTTFGPKEMTVDQTAVFDGVELGSSCTASEDAVAAGLGLADESFAWNGEPTVSPASLTATEGANSFEVTNTIDRVYGQITLMLDLDDPDDVVDHVRPYFGEWVCTHEGDPDVSGRWKIKGVGEAQLLGVADDGILLGSVCTPTQDAFDKGPSKNGDAAYSWLDPGFESAVAIAPPTTPALARMALAAESDAPRADGVMWVHDFVGHEAPPVTTTTPPTTPTTKPTEVSPTTLVKTPPTTPAPSGSGHTPPPASRPTRLARTGANVSGLAGLGLVLIGAGIVVSRSRRRQRAQV